MVIIIQHVVPAPCGGGASDLKKKFQARGKLLRPSTSSSDVRARPEAPSQVKCMALVSVHQLLHPLTITTAA